MTSGKKILIVDDEPSVVTYLTTLLEDAGFETVSAGDGAEGLDKVRSEKPDLVTLDITMPKKSGVKLYREMREDAETASIPVVVVTAVTGKGGSSEEFEQFLASRKQIPPPNAFMAKPIEPESFVAKIRELLG